MLKEDNTLKSREDVENYALSLIIPLLEKLNPVWDPDNPLKGRPHWTNHHSTYLEGLGRPLWVLPYILNNRKEPIYVKYQGKNIKIEDWYKIALLSGTNPNLKSYWGEYYKYGQVCTEIAPLVITLYLTKDKIWDDFTSKEKKMIWKWLYKIAQLTPIETHRNNHYWFPIFINLGLKRLGLKYNKEILKENLKKVDNFYMGEGWYYDGTIGRYDYYIAWSHHFYPLLWLLLENPEEKYYKEIKEKYCERTNKFLKYYIYFFDSNGLNVPWGRSLAYRFAASSIFPLAVYHKCNISPSLAKSINLKNLNLYKNNGAEPGKITPPGVTYPSTQNVERYISVVSSYWFTKGFIGLLMDKNHPFWKSKFVKLPIEKKEFKYKIKLKDVNIEIQGNKNDGIFLYNNSAYILIGGFGSTNELYSKFVYNSRSGFGTSTKDLISMDNMISLATTNSFATSHLASHRGIFKDLGERKNIYYSEHIPFSNDEKSKIKSALIPLSKGFHIRIHKVILSQPYYVIEGGFTCGKRNDFQEIKKGKNWISVITEAGTSYIKTFTQNIDLIFQVKKVHPEAHILYPIAIYPVYATKKKLEKGEYIFITLFKFSSSLDLNKIIKEEPKIKLKDNIITIFDNKKIYTLNLNKF